MDNDQLITEKDFQYEIKEQINKNTYTDGTPFNLDRNEFNISIKDYLSNIAAVDLISTKNIDALVSENEIFNKQKTKEFNKFLKEQFLEKKIYELAKQVALNGSACLFLHPTFGISKHKYALSLNCSIIKLTRINNEIQSCEMLVKFIDGINSTPIYGLVKVDDKSFKSEFYTNKQISNESKINDNEKPLDKNEFKCWFENNDLATRIWDALNCDHNFNFVPVFLFSINESMAPLIRNIDNDLNELFSIASKCYDEAHYMGTKVKSVNSGMSDNETDEQEAQIIQKTMAASVILHASNLFDENGEPQVDVITKQPIWQILNDAFKQKINFILKKIGISSDTDSKGTVQQSIGEVIKQNEYSYNNQNYRNLILQNFLQDMLEKVYAVNFNDQDEVRVISSQSLGMSEYEKLRYVIEAKNNNLMDEARAMSVLSGKNYIESLELLELFKLNLEPEDLYYENENRNLENDKEELNNQEMIKEE